MVNIIVLVACLLIGAGLRADKRLPPDAFKAINSLIIHIAMPAVVFRNIHALQFSPSLFIVALMPWLIFGTGVIFFMTLGRILRWDRATVGALSLAAGFGNNAFIGLPMIEAFYGAQWIGVGAIGAQLGITLGTNTAGVVAAAYFGQDGRVQPAIMLRRILTFPPFQAFLLALALRPVEMPPVLDDVLLKLGALLGPLAMLSVASQLDLATVTDRMSTLVAGIGYKLLVAPALAVLTVFLVCGFDSKVGQIAVFQAAMGPAVTGAILAAEFGLNTRVCSTVVGVGTLLSLGSAVVWYGLVSILLLGSRGG